jgi:hypothetical protein
MLRVRALCRPANRLPGSTGIGSAGLDRSSPTLSTSAARESRRVRRELVIVGRGPPSSLLGRGAGVGYPPPRSEFGGFPAPVVCLGVGVQVWSRPIVHGRLPKARKTHAMAAIGTKVYLFGGHDGEEWLKDFHVLEMGALCACARLWG